VKPAHTPQAEPEAPVRVEFQVQFADGPKGRRQARVTQPTEHPEQESSATSVDSPAQEPVRKASLNRVPKITRLLVLGYHFEKLVREGIVKDYAEIARLTGLSRARVTQIANLTLLAPETQERILPIPAPTSGPYLTEHNLRHHATEVDWKAQHLLLCTTVLEVCSEHLQDQQTPTSGRRVLPPRQDLPWKS